MRNRIIILIGVGVLAVACLVAGAVMGNLGRGSEMATVQAFHTPAPLPTYTPGPSGIATKLVTVEVTRIVERLVTTTPLPTSAATNAPAITDTPAPTDTEVATPNAQTATAEALGPLVAPHDDGNFLVNVDIAPGVWRNNSTDADCYWQLKNKTGDTIKNYLGAGGGTMYVAPTAFEVHTERCATWTYLSPP